MKKVIVSFCLIILSSCSSGDKLPSDNELADLTIDSILNYFPYNIYTTNSSAVYKDIDGNEKYLEITNSEKIVESQVASLPYKSNRLSVSLTDPATIEYAINLIVGADYSTIDNSNTYILISLMNEVNNGFIQTIGMTESVGGLMSNFNEPEMILNGKSFFNVHYNITVPEHVTSYSEIYFNTEFGIIGYTDNLDTLWVLDRYL
jgi:hypothetical protein